MEGKETVEYSHSYFGMSAFPPRFKKLFVLAALTSTAIIFTIALRASPVDAPQERLSHSVFGGAGFFAIALTPPGTSGAVAMYTQQFGTSVASLPAKGSQSAGQGYLDCVPNQNMTQGKRATVSIAIALTKDDLDRVRKEVFASVFAESGSHGINVVSTELIFGVERPFVP
jgi:hypothetical protein